MEDQQKKKKSFLARGQNYILTGVLTVIPLVVTWFIVEFVFDILSSFGRPFVINLARGVEPFSVGLADFLRHSFFQYFLAILLVLILLSIIGWIATKVIGRKIIEFFDSIMVKIPVVNTIYGSMKKLLTSLQQKPDSVQRVVLIDFPEKGKKAVGLVTKTFKESKSGRNMAVVFVPMSPNPTGGFLEILPVSKLISTDWTIDEAMTFIVSGGTVSPENMDYFEEELSEEVIDKKAKKLDKSAENDQLYSESDRPDENEN
jgi:uncharacterized membrane protein